MGRAYPKREITARKEYFAQTDEVIGLFHQTAEQAQSGMKSLVLLEREAPKKAVKLYDAETGSMTGAVKQEEEYPMLRSMGLGFCICLLLWIGVMFLAQVV